MTTQEKKDITLYFPQSDKKSFLINLINKIVDKEFLWNFLKRNSSRAGRKYEAVFMKDKSNSLYKKMKMRQKEMEVKISFKKVNRIILFSSGIEDFAINLDYESDKDLLWEWLKKHSDEGEYRTILGNKEKSSYSGPLKEMQERHKREKQMCPSCGSHLEGNKKKR